MKMNKCKYCGGKPRMNYTMGNYATYWVTCKNCDRSGYDSFTRDGAKATWNDQNPEAKKEDKP